MVVKVVFIFNIPIQQLLKIIYLTSEDKQSCIPKSMPDCNYQQSSVTAINSGYVSKCVPIKQIASVTSS